MLVIILYYVNLIKWTANETDLNTYERFISLEKPELSFESIINFQPDDRSSNAAFDAASDAAAASPFRNSNRQSPQSPLSSNADANLPPNQLNQPHSNRSNPSLPNLLTSPSRASDKASSESDSSFSPATHEDRQNSATSSTSGGVTSNDATRNSATSNDVTGSGVKSDSVTESSPVERRLTSGTNRPEGSKEPRDNQRGDDKPRDSAAVPNYQLNAEASETNSELNLNKLHLNPTKATSLQSSSNRLTDFNSILTADLSPSVEQLDRTSFAGSYYLESGVRGLPNSAESVETVKQAVRLLDEDSNQQEQKISESVHSIQVLSSKHKVELKIDNQIVS